MKTIVLALAIVLTLGLVVQAGKVGTYSSEEYSSVPPVKAKLFRSPPNTLIGGYVAKSGPGWLVSLTVANKSEAQEFLQVFDATAVPANGPQAPIWFGAIPGRDAAGNPGTINANWGSVPLKFSSGLALVCSSTGPDKTTAIEQCVFTGQML